MFLHDYSATSRRKIRKFSPLGPPSWIKSCAYPIRFTPALQPCRFP